MSLGDGSEGTGPAVCLSVLRRAQYSNDEKPLMQVLVNCGECACRILNETRTKLSRVSHVLVTRCEPTRISGISSLLFHLSDKGSASLSFVGPTPLHSYIETVRTFVRRRFPEIEVAEVGAEGDKGFAFNSSSDDPDTFAWAQSRAPHTGVSIHAIPMTATSNKRQKTLHGDCIENSSSRSRPVLSYAFLIRGPPPQPHKDSDANATRQTLFVVVDHADEQVDASQVCQAITSWLEQMEMKSKDGKLRDDLHQRVMLHLGTRSVLESAEFRSLRERDVFQLFQHVELCTNEASSGPCAVEKEEIEMILDTGRSHEI
ncbi:hypothetical protein GUITHDRAFT_107767 [Guillardia theta CCMP2712]|uniref:ribonuclease Z n=1 Tax=Guillardia theta (strain CCMP2712) TaxID=905079 RepID=L1JDE3_GUITC|nr:hypothetical protein GUITHDRAFT_107767 [Guillardia theta CCMP2712]EKX46563.1 hypothetical protein GUITHDRAFT_107767 [Guillardia theta CCMP2712]|eukprot:XP_005833543.1 hypothetical protein GUITHDRAFT_107767 [Guillardia theta CCMP2712]